MPEIKKFKIGTLEFKNNLLLSPMAGITGYAFRKTCLENGCGLAISEMVSSESVSHGNKKSIEMLRVRDDIPTAIQIFGSSPEAMLYTAQKAEALGAGLIEINASCPVKKILKTGAGAQLMRTPALLGKIVETLAKKLKKPVSVKIRTGWTDEDNLALEAAKIIENSGADCLHIHLRSVAQVHSGDTDRALGRKIKKNLKIPLIANGGVNSPEKAAEMLEETGCDAVSIGRAAVSNPLIFKEINDFLNGRETKKTSNQERLDLFIKFLRLNCETIGEDKGLKTSRKLIGLWLKSLPNASALRGGFMKVRSLAEAKELLKLQ